MFTLAFAQLKHAYTWALIDVNFAVGSSESFGALAGESPWVGAILDAGGAVGTRRRIAFVDQLPAFVRRIHVTLPTHFSACFGRQGWCKVMMTALWRRPKSRNRGINSKGTISKYSFVISGFVWLFVQRHSKCNNALWSASNVDVFHYLRGVTYVLNRNNRNNL